MHIPFVEKGHFGVDAFFVISGYVMMLSTQISGERFFVKRLIRIVPTYYALTLVVFIIALVFPSLLNNTTADSVHLVKSLLFIPFDKNGTGHAPILFLGWTLNYEMYFYLLFAIALGVSHRYRGVVVSLVIFSVWCLCSIVDVFITRVYGDLIVFEFVLGILLYMVLVQRSYRQIAIIVIMLAFAMMAADDPVSSRFFYAGLPSLLVIYLALIIFKNRVLPKTLVLLGSASYVLYLIHPYVIQVFDKVSVWFEGSILLQWLAASSSLVLANVAAVLIYRYLETPVRTYLRKHLVANSPNRHLSGRV